MVGGKEKRPVEIQGMPTTIRYLLEDQAAGKKVSIKLNVMTI